MQTTEESDFTNLNHPYIIIKSQSHVYYCVVLVCLKVLSCLILKNYKKFNKFNFCQQLEIKREQN